MSKKEKNWGGTGVSTGIIVVLIFLARLVGRRLPLPSSLSHALCVCIVCMRQVYLFLRQSYAK